MFNQPIPPITKNLLIINGLFYLAKIVMKSRGIDLDVLFSAFYPESVNFQSWQILTHMFMHGNEFHLFFNMFALWMFGSTVENTLGQKKFLILYFTAGLGAFILFNFTNYLQIEPVKEAVAAMGVDVAALNDSLKLKLNFDRSFPLPNDSEQVMQLARNYIAPMMGASGAIYGVLVAFGVLYPNAKLAFLFFPVPVKAKYFIPVMIAFEFYLGIENYAWNPIAHFAHIGGAVIGFILVWNWKKNLHRRY